MDENQRTNLYPVFLSAFLIGSLFYILCMAALIVGFPLSVPALFLVLMATFVHVILSTLVLDRGREMGREGWLSIVLFLILSALALISLAVAHALHAAGRERIFWTIVAVVHGSLLSNSMEAFYRLKRM